MKLKDISEDDVQDIADSSAILARGVNYFETDQIKSIEVEDGTIKAKVYGSYGTYDVEISIENGEICADCDCPYDGYGCKHIVAVLYKWIKGKNKTGSKKIAKRKKEKSMDFRKEISKLGQEEVISILLALCQKNEDVKRDVILRIGKEGADKEGKDIIFKQIENALDVRSEYIDYYSMTGVIRELEKIKESIICSSPAIKTLLLKKLIKESRKAFEHCDDSDGEMGSFIIDCLIELGNSIHEQGLSFKEKKVIIQENFELLKEENYGLEGGYINLLLTIPSTKKDFDFMIKELKAIIEEANKDYERRRYGDILAEIYRRAGKDNEYLAILEGKAKEEGDYLPLAGYWKEKGKIKKAIEEAERGIKTKRRHWYYKQTDLFEFLEEIYKGKKDEENLLRILSLHFRESPSLFKYKEIMKIAERLKCWKNLKRQLLQQTTGQALIEIYLFEKELEKAFAKIMGSPDNYSDRFRDKVARALIKEFPEKALKIYLPIVKQFIDKSGRDYYRIAALYAKKIKEIHLRLNQSEKWSNYISCIREQNIRKSALIDEFKRL